MTEYWVCSDNIDGKENARINALCSALKKKGHTATNGGVGPNTVQSKGRSSSSKGMIGVFIVGGSDAGMYVDFRDGVKRPYYHYKRMEVVFASETATTDKWITCNGLANTPLVRAWDDNYSGSNIEAVGKTAKAYFEANKEYIGYSCGKKGCTFDDVINNFLDGSGDGSASDSSKGGGGSNVKDCIQKLLKHWDGDVECYIRGDEIHINKVRKPEDYYSCEIKEDTNVILDSITVTDVNPDTPNHLTVTWTGGTIEFRDERAIARFGEKPKEMEAVRKVVKVVYEETDSDEEESDEDTEEETTE